jgi:hypothetical protein
LSWFTDGLEGKCDKKSSLVLAFELFSYIAGIFAELSYLVLILIESLVPYYLHLGEVYQKAFLWNMLGQDIITDIVTSKLYWSRLFIVVNTLTVVLCSWFRSSKSKKIPTNDSFTVEG